MSAPKQWTLDKLIDAVHLWVAMHGRPPLASDWKGAPGWPSTSVVVETIGWLNLLEEAGYPRPEQMPAESRTVKPELEDDRPFPMSGAEASRFGAILTFENDAGKRLVLHRRGRIRAAVKDAIADALSLDDTFRVVSFSTPSSIFRDLHGDRIIQSSAWPQLPESSSIPRAMLHRSIRQGVPK